MTETKKESVFINSNNFEAEAQNHNRKCEIIGHHFNPHDVSVVDVDAMPQFAIRFTDDESEYTAYPEEIPEADWTDEMKCFLDGQNGTDLVPNLHHLEAYGFGKQVSKHKGL